jgi:hypothetical protein
LFLLTDIVASQPSKKEIHVIADNLSAQKPGGEPLFGHPIMALN